MTASSFRRVPRGYRRPLRKIYGESPFGGRASERAVALWRAHVSENEEIGTRGGQSLSDLSPPSEEPPLDVIDRLTFRPQFQPLSTFSAPSHPSHLIPTLILGRLNRTA